MAIAATPVKHIENDTTVVTEWRFAPGAETGWHTHGMAYVVLPLMDGQLKLESPDGTVSFADLTAHVPYYRDAGVHHNVINANDFDFSFVEIELKPA